ncbi:hypothetical protein [Acinetobacter sp. YH12021]|uniref:hypothetical protein n=1 Tax=Acinetobacter sp. YH12021 TaxID=2601040 RepID=UPI0015D28FE6|nr:hypothetical protein [Acinetobacter sp. YH12021]
MDIHQEKWDYTAMLVAENAITQEQCDTLKLSDGINMFYSDHLASTTIDCINWGWSSWLKAKARAVPDGFVVVPKEPTPKMIDATWDYFEDIEGMSHNKRNEFIYKAMIDEAQEQAND